MKKLKKSSKNPHKLSFEQQIRAQQIHNEIHALLAACHGDLGYLALAHPKTSQKLHAISIMIGAMLAESAGEKIV